MTRAQSVERALDENAPALLGYFLRRVQNPADAADLVSETALAAWRSARRMPRDATEARMWLFGVARNTLLHHVRSTVRRDALHSRLTDAIRTSPAAAETEAAVEVRAAVDALPTDLGELIRLVHWDGFTLADAAHHLGVSASTLRSRHARAKELLRDALAEIPAGG